MWNCNCKGEAISGLLPPGTHHIKDLSTSPFVKWLERISECSPSTYCCLPASIKTKNHSGTLDSLYNFKCLINNTYRFFNSLSLLFIEKQVLLSFPKAREDVSFFEPEFSLKVSYLQPMASMLFKNCLWNWRKIQWFSSFFEYGG